MSEAVSTVSEKIDSYLTKVHGEGYGRDTEQPNNFRVRNGSAIVNISVQEWGDDEAVVLFRAWVIQKAEMTPDLMYYLLRKNDSMRFGAFGIDGDHDIFFEHSIVGSTCDIEEFRASLKAVAVISDGLDDEIQGQFGGLRATDVGSE
jgi:hypothetical protein